MALLWKRGRPDDVQDLQERYEEIFKQTEYSGGKIKLREIYFDEVLQLFERNRFLSLFSSTKPHNIFLCYKPPTLQRNDMDLTIVAFKEEEKDQYFSFSEFDMYNRQIAKEFRKLMKEMGIELKNMFKSRIKEKNPVPNATLADLTNQLLRKLMGLDEHEDILDKEIELSEEEKKLMDNDEYWAEKIKREREERKEKKANDYHKNNS